MFQVLRFIGRYIGHLDVIGITLIHMAVVFFKLRTTIISLSNLGSAFTSQGIGQVGLKSALDISGHSLPSHGLERIRPIHVSCDVGRAICNKLLRKRCIIDPILHVFKVLTSIYAFIFRRARR